MGTKLRHVALGIAGSHRNTYSDRLFLAHFAIITFGLVASFGNWNDSFMRFSMMCGMSATLCLLCFGMEGSFIRGTPALWRSDSFFFIAPAREGSVSHETLDYIRHANLLAGAPPAPLNTFITSLGRLVMACAGGRSPLLFQPPNPFLSGGIHVISCLSLKTI